MTVVTDRPRWSSIATFFALSYALTWALLPFARISVAFSLLALFGPAAAAVITATLSGRHDLRDLGNRFTKWRVGIRWYLLALLLPLPISTLRSSVELALGAPGPIQLQPVAALDLIVFVLVVGEEAGWRGFALPRLAERVGRIGASVVIGVLWAVWHLPLFYMPAMPQYGNPIVPYIGYTIALSIILSVLTLGSSGSVVIATLFHGAVNAFGITNAGTAPTLRGWTNALSYGVAAIVIGMVAWRRGLTEPVQLTSGTIAHLGE